MKKGLSLFLTFTMLQMMIISMLPQAVKAASASNDTEAMYVLDSGDYQMGGWTSSGPNLQVTANEHEQEIAVGNGTTKFQFGTVFEHADLSMTSPIDASAADALEFDLFGTGDSSQTIRVSLASTAKGGAYLYKDISLGFVGWKHFAYRLNSAASEDRMDFWANGTSYTQADVLSSLNIVQVSGPWAGSSFTTYWDNVVLSQTPAVGYTMEDGTGTFSASGLSVASNSAEQQVDGTGSIKVTMSPNFDQASRSLGSSIDLSSYDTVQFDVYGDNSEAVARIEFYSDAAQGFLYEDVKLDFSGWKHYNLDLSETSNAIPVYPTTSRTAVTSSVNLLVINGTWNNTAGTCFIDNIKFYPHSASYLPKIMDTVIVSAGQNNISVNSQTALAVTSMGDVMSAQIVDGYKVYQFQSGPVDLTNADITYASSDASVATVDAGGVVTGISAGTAAIIASVTMNGTTVLGTVNVTVGQVSSDTSFAYPKSPQAPTRLYAVHSNDLTIPELVMISSLQGLLAKTKPEIYVIDDTRPAYTTWLNDLEQNDGVSIILVVNDSNGRAAEKLVEQFKDRYSNYIVYDATTSLGTIGSSQKINDSLNVASSLAGLKQTLLVEKTFEPAFLSYQWGTVQPVKTLDVSDKTMAWLVQQPEYHQLRKDLMIELENLDVYEGMLRDYAIMTNSLVFYDSTGPNTPIRQKVIGDLQPNTPVLGWGNYYSGEDTFIEPTTRGGHFYVAANWCSDMSVLSAFHIPHVTQKNHDPVPQGATPGKHYVTFLMSDGDNLQYAYGGFEWAGRLYDSPSRGGINVSWGVPASMVDLAPTALQNIYNRASDGTLPNRPGKDEFVFMSPGGYMYPSMFPKDELADHASKLNDEMGRSDIHILGAIDKGQFSQQSLPLWDTFTSQSNLDAIFYVDYNGYKTNTNGILWSNDKPVIPSKAVFWQGLSGADAQGISDYLKSTPTDPSNAAAYSLITVHVWSKTVDELVQLGQQLQDPNSPYYVPNTEIVTPQTFVNLIKKNVTPEPLDQGGGTADHTAIEPLYILDSGDYQMGERKFGNGMITFTPNSAEQQKSEGNPSSRFTMGTVYDFCNMNTGNMSVPGATSLEFDLFGTGEGTSNTIRLQLWSTTSGGAFLYKDIPLGFDGWRHFSLSLDPQSSGTKMDFYPNGTSSTYENVKQNIDIFQVSGPWSGQNFTFYMDNVAILGHPSSVYTVENGTTRQSPYTTNQISVSTDSIEQRTDGTPSTKFVTGTGYGEAVMDFGQVQEISAFDNVQFDLYGDGSGATERIEFYSTAVQAFMYKDIPLDFTGWRHFTFNLDGTNDGMQVYPDGARKGVLSSVDKFSVSGPWNGKSASFYLDNVQLYKSLLSKQLTSVEATADKNVLDQNETVPIHVRGTTNQWQPVSYGGSAEYIQMSDSLSVVDAEVTYTSSNPSVVSVDANGVVKAIGNGEATVTVSVVYRGVTKSAVLNFTCIQDRTPPVTTASWSPAEPNGSNGWYIQPVTLSLTATDDGQSGIKTEISLDDGHSWLPYTEPVRFDQTVVNVILYRSIDGAGNVEQAHSKRIEIDLEPPSVEFQTPKNEDVFQDDLDLSLSLLVTDSLSGVDTAQTKVELDGQQVEMDQVIQMYSLPLGNHELIVWAVDKAGNPIQATAKFSTGTGIPSLKNLVDRFILTGWIDNDGLANSLQKKLDQKKDGLQDFVNEVQAQSGKHITQYAASLLLRDALALSQGV